MTQHNYNLKVDVHCLPGRIQAIVTQASAVCAEILVLAESGAAICFAQNNARVLLECSEPLGCLVTSCEHILDSLAALRHCARGYNIPAADPKRDDDTWVQIKPLIDKVAALASRLSDIPGGTTQIHDQLDAQLHYNLDLLYGGKRTPRLQPRCCASHAANLDELWGGADPA